MNKNSATSNGKKGKVRKNNKVNARRKDRVSKAPVTFGRTIELGAPEQLPQPDGSIRIRHRSYFADVVSSTTNSAFSIVPYVVNPGNSLMFPWLSGVVSGKWDVYVCNHLEVSFYSTQATSLAGVVDVCFDPDTTDDPPSSKQQMMAFECSQRAKAWEDTVMTIQKKFLQNRKTLYVSSNAGGSVVGINGIVSNIIVQLPESQNVPSTSLQSALSADTRLNDVGVIYVASSGVSSSGVYIGELYVTYDFTFRQTELPSATVGPGLALCNTSPVGTALGPTNIDPMALTSTVNKSLSPLILSEEINVGLFIGNSTDRLYLAPGTYQIVVDIDATTITSLTSTAIGIGSKILDVISTFNPTAGATLEVIFQSVLPLVLGTAGGNYGSALELFATGLTGGTTASTVVSTLSDAFRYLSSLLPTLRRRNGACSYFHGVFAKEEPVRYKALCDMYCCTGSGLGRLAVESRRCEDGTVQYSFSEPPNLLESVDSRLTEEDEMLRELVTLRQEVRFMSEERRRLKKCSPPPDIEDLPPALTGCKPTKGVRKSGLRVSRDTKGSYDEYPNGSTYWKAV